MLMFEFPQDLKAFNYYYHFAYPCLSTPIFERIDAPKLATDFFSAEQMEALTKIYLPLSSENRSFFIIESSNSSKNSFKYSKLADKITVSNNDNFKDANLDEIYFCFSDPCSNIEYGGWPMRLFLLMLTHLWYDGSATFIASLQQFTIHINDILSIFQSEFERENHKNRVTSFEKISVA